MKANSTHISLETAKLLEGKLKIDNEWGYYSTSYDNYTDYFISGNKHYWRTQPNYPAYTWQEILWEYTILFFGENEIEQDLSVGITDIILFYLQRKEYDEADKYFRDNCILIK
jgi:hypothetical protein